jgi:hypothetical protein
MARASASWPGEKYFVILIGATCFDEGADAAVRGSSEEAAWVALLIAAAEDDE